MLRGVNGSGGGAPVGGSGTTNTIPRWTGPSTLGDSALVQTGTNVVGFGTPKTWGTNFTTNAIQLSESGSLAADINTTYLAANQYWNSPGFTNLRIKANFAARYLLNGATGDHQFQIAPFGAADSTITWTTAMTILNTSGNVGIGTASPGAKLDVSDTANQLRATVSNSTPAVTTYALGTREGYISARQENSGSFNVFTDIVSSTSQFTPSGLRFFTHASGDASISERARIDSSGNLGLGVTPSAWGSSYRAFQTVGTTLGSNSTNGTYYTQNAFFDGTNWKYVTTAAANRYQMLSGVHSWHTASSGTAGNNITFTQAMTLDASGNVYAGSGTTGMTDGFFYIAAAAGAPTGTPTAVSGRVPMYYDTTNNKFYIYNGAWKQVALT